LFCARVNQTFCCRPRGPQRPARRPSGAFMTFHLTDNRAGFGPGLTQVTRHDEANQNTGISFGVLRLKSGETWRSTPTGETAYLLMEGTATLAAAGREETWSRRSLFGESPSW